jgi:pimeloyl-ACP methyl ester carboxylesterase
MIPESIFVDVQGLRIQVSAWGDPGKPALFLLHGMRDHSRSWAGSRRNFLRTAIGCTSHRGRLSSV